MIYSSLCYNPTCFAEKLQERVWQRPEVSIIAVLQITSHLGQQGSNLSIWAFNHKFENWAFIRRWQILIWPAIRYNKNCTTEDSSQKKHISASCHVDIFIITASFFTILFNKQLLKSERRLSLPWNNRLIKNAN